MKEVLMNKKKKQPEKRSSRRRRRRRSNGKGYLDQMFSGRLKAPQMWFHQSGAYPSEGINLPSTTGITPGANYIPQSALVPSTGSTGLINYGGMGNIPLTTQLVVSRKKQRPPTVGDSLMNTMIRPGVAALLAGGPAAAGLTMLNPKGLKTMGEILSWQGQNLKPLGKYDFMHWLSQGLASRGVNPVNHPVISHDIDALVHDVVDSLKSDTVLVNTYNPYSGITTATF